MIQSISVTNHLNETLELELGSPGSSGFSILNIDGLGPPKAQINQTNVLSLDGQVWNSSRVDGRNILLSLGLMWMASRTIEDARLELYKYFPIKQQITFGIETTNRSAIITGYVESNAPDIFSQNETAEISIVCPNAYFYSTEVTRVSFSGIDTGFTFPFSNEDLANPLIEFGSIQISTERSLYYAGDAAVGIVINIHALGPVTDILVHSPTTGMSMSIDTDRIFDITGFTLGAGDDIIISTLKGNKYITFIRDGIEYNILNALDRDTEWFELVKGDNHFVYNAATGVADLQFEIEYQLLYEGV